MVATPQFGSIMFIGNSGQTYNKDIYINDVDEAVVRFDQGGGGASATSAEYWTAPEPVLMRDLAVITGTVDTEKLRVSRNDVPTGHFLRYTLHLNTLSNRPPLNIPFDAGDQVKLIQSSD